jgi:hypothetical protein
MSSSILIRMSIACLLALGLACEKPASQTERPSRRGPHPTSRPSQKPELPDANDYGKLLAKVVVKGRVDYAELAKHKSVLDAYVAGIAKANLAGASDVQKLAFYINAYNAVTLELVLDRVIGKGKDGKDKPSVMAVPGFFKQIAVTVAGEKLSLDEIEKRGRALGDPRIHFAVNCAAISCPPLRGHEWRPERLDRDLGMAAADFLASPHGLQVENGKVEVSRLFDWYASDFGGKESVRNFLLRYAPERAKQLLDRSPGFLDYDWSLNKNK